MDLKDKKIKINYVDLFLVILFIGQIGFLCYINLFHTADMVDFDSSGAYVHIREIMRQHSLFPSTYNYATTMDIDSTVGIAAILYAITGRIFFSQGLCNILIIGCYIFVISEICKRLKLNLSSSLLVLILFFLPYSRGMLGYMSMLFINVAPNTIRDLTPIFYMSVLLDIHDKDYSIKTKIKAAVVLIFLLATTISTGFYVFAFGLLALIFMDFVFVIFSGDIKGFLEKNWFLHASAVIVFLIGSIIQKTLSFSSAASTQKLVKATEMSENFQKWFVGIFELFGGVTPGDCTVFNVNGLETLFKYVLTLFYLSTIVYFVCVWVKKKSVPRYASYGLMVFLIDSLALNALNVTYGSPTYEYRYHIIAMFFVLVMAGTLMGKAWDVKNILLKNTLIFAILAVLTGTIIFGDICTDKEIKACSNAEDLAEINKMLVDDGVKTAVVFGNESVNEGRQLRAFADDVNIIVVYDDWSTSATEWGGVRYAFDNANQKGKAALLLDMNDIDKIPAYLMEGAKPIDMIENIGVYEYEKSPFDFETGLDDYDYLVDLPYRGFERGNSTVQEDGSVLSDGTFGSPIFGPYYDGVDGIWTYTLEYEIESEKEENKGETTFEIVSDEKIIKQMKLDADKTKAVLEDVEINSDMHRMETRVTAQDGTIIRIKSVTMERRNK